jgi:hypothetical protein
VNARVTSIVIDCDDPVLVATFWHGAIGGNLSVDADGDAIVALAAPAVRLDFLRVPERKSVKNRLHIDVNAVDGDQDRELARLLALGARRIDIGQGEYGTIRRGGQTQELMNWYVLADPEGNEFCLLAGPA